MATRDLPKSFRDFSMGWLDHLNEEVTFNRKTPSQIEEEKDEERIRKVSAKSLFPVFVSGAGLFSDGYVNNSISTVSTILGKLYPHEYNHSNAISNVTSIAFVGTVVGQLSFGLISDRFPRRNAMLAANVMLIVLPTLCGAASWGAHGSPYGLFAAITAFRFLLGIGIGAEYPTSSVIASEFANQLPSGQRNRYFAWFTNFMIDFGFVVSSFVPLVLLWIFSERHLTAVWRLTLCLGSIFPIILFFFRMQISDSDSFKQTHMKRVHFRNVPYWLIIKFYWFRLTIVSLIWFIYDFSAYSFGLFSPTILNSVVPDKSMYKTFGWNVVFNLFYIPGAFLGAIATDYFGPRLTLAVGVGLQGAVGFIMTGLYDKLSKHIAPFVVVYGIFMTLGEFGPGDNTGLLAAKTSATPIRGVYYGIAAAVGKIGAFVGTWVFPVIIKHTGITGAFYVSSGLCMLSAFLAIFFLPAIGQDAVNAEDKRFLDYLRANNFDVALLGEVREQEDGTDSFEQNDKKIERVNVASSSKSTLI